MFTGVFIPVGDIHTPMTIVSDEKSRMSQLLPEQVKRKISNMEWDKKLTGRKVRVMLPKGTEIAKKKIK